MQGIRTDIKVEKPPNCPIAEISGEVETTCKFIDWDNLHNSEVTEEFISEKELESEDLNEIFNYGSEKLYRLKRNRSECTCYKIQDLDIPISDVYAKNGDLFVSFHSSDVENLREVLNKLRDKRDIQINSLIQSSNELDGKNESTFISTDNLTERQRQVLKTAFEMGYFEHPKKANAGEVAERLDITTSTLVEHLSTAQTKIIKQILKE